MFRVSEDVSMRIALAGYLAGCLAATCSVAQPLWAQTPQQLRGITVTAPQPRPPTSTASTAPAVPEPTAASEAKPTDGSDFGAVQSFDPRAADVGVAQSSSQGVVVPAQLLAQPVYRTRCVA